MLTNVLFFQNPCPANVTDAVCENIIHQILSSVTMVTYFEIDANTLPSVIGLGNIGVAKLTVFSVMVRLLLPHC
jgi:hypothetical protein